MLHDLFQSDGDTSPVISLRDPALLDRLVTEKLRAEAETVVVEGWEWIELALDMPCGYRHGLRSLFCDPVPMTDAEDVVHTKRLSEYRALEEGHAEQNATAAELDRRPRVTEAGMEEIEALPLDFNPTDIGRAGAFVTLDRYGALVVYRAYDYQTPDESVEDGNTAYEYTYTGPCGGSDDTWKGSTHLL